MPRTPTGDRFEITPTASIGISSPSAWHRGHHPRSEPASLQHQQRLGFDRDLRLLCHNSLPSIQEHRAMPVLLVKHHFTLPQGGRICPSVRS